MMLEYEWGIPSSMMHPGEELSQVQDQTHKFFDHYYAAQSFNNDLLLQPVATSSFHRPNTHSHHQLNALYDPSPYADASSYAPPIPCLFALDDPLQIHSFAASGHSYFLVPKTEENVGWPRQDFTARIGLNLGGRTYFSSAGDDFANCLYRRCRPVEPGSSNSPRCQAEGCNADLTHAKHYHRRHKVCEFHSKASTVIAAGLTQRFCQQCSRFHLLSEFDNGKRSCRKRLADHNRRRRKSHQRQPETSENLTDSGNHNPSSAVTVAVSNPRMFLDCFKQRSLFQCTTSSSASSSSLFFSSG